MPGTHRRSLIAIPLALGVLLLSDGAVRADPRVSTEAVRAEGQRVLERVRPHGQFELVQASADGYVLELRGPQGALGALYVEPGRLHQDAPRLRSRRFTYKIGDFSPDPTVIDRLVHAAHAVVAWDGGASPEAPVHPIHAPLQDLLISTLLVLALAVGLGVARRAKLQLDIRPPLLIQVFVQGSVFVYWAIYWPAVVNQLPAIGLMLVMGYAADAAFSFLRYRSWRIGLGTIPVVFSVNLFEWLDYRGALVTILGAFATKAYVQRAGRHVLNPSAAGLALTAIVTVLAPGWVHFGGVFHTMNVPPNLAEWILLVAILPQSRFRILPVSIGAALGLILTNNPATARPAIILAIALLATDPATIPKNDLGKLLYGLAVGLGIPVFSQLLRALGQPDDFAKVLPIPFANLFVAQFDALGVVLLAWVAARWSAFRPRRLPNLVLAAIWLALMYTQLARRKPFEAALHWNWGTPLVVRDADDVPRCASNPMFCQPFSFAQELAAWDPVTRRDGMRSVLARVPRPLRLWLLSLVIAELSLRALFALHVWFGRPPNCGMEPTLARLHYAYSHGRYSTLPGENDRTMQYDAHRGHKHRAGLRKVLEGGARVSTNRLGARGAREYAQPKPAGVLRVVALGDSQTFGEGAADAETWPAQLERALAGVEVLNFGERAYAHDQMYFALLDDGLAVQPDAVVVGYFDNDAWRDTREFYCYEKPRFVYTDAGWSVENQPVPRPAEVRTRYLWQPLLLAVPWALFGYVSDPLNRDPVGGFSEAEAILGRMRAASEAAGARFVLVYLTERVGDEPHRDGFFHTYCASTGTECVDPWPRFRALAGTTDPTALRQRFLRPNDIHYSAAGYAVVAEALRAHFAEHPLRAAPTRAAGVDSGR